MNATQVEQSAANPEIQNLRASPQQLEQINATGCYFYVVLAGANDFSFPHDLIKNFAANVGRTYEDFCGDVMNLKVRLFAERQAMREKLAAEATLANLAKNKIFGEPYESWEEMPENLSGKVYHDSLSGDLLGLPKENPQVS